MVSGMTEVDSQARSCLPLRWPSIFTLKMSIKDIERETTIMIVARANGKINHGKVAERGAIFFIKSESVVDFLSRLQGKATKHGSDCFRAMSLGMEKKISSCLSKFLDAPLCNFILVMCFHTTKNKHLVG